MYVYYLVFYLTFSIRIFKFKFLYLWRHVSVLIYHLQAIFQKFANNLKIKYLKLTKITVIIKASLWLKQQC
jgi:hypothetical protein